MRDIAKWQDPEHLNVNFCGVILIIKPGFLFPSHQVKVEEAEHFREGREQEVKVQLRGERGDEPGKSQRSRQQHDTRGELECVYCVREDILRSLPQRQR